MKLYYFFEQDENGSPDYGEHFFVMAFDPITAITQVSNKIKSEGLRIDVNKLGMKECNENEVINLEVS